MSAWCPRCDELRPGPGACQQCQAELVPIDDRPARRGRVEVDEMLEAGPVVEPPPRGRLRVAVAVAAIVLVGLAFVAGRGTSGAAATAPRESPGTTVSQTTAPPQSELRRDLGWRSDPVRGVTVEAVSISRAPSGDQSGDNAGALALRVEGVASGRRVLGITGVRLLDSGGGAFAKPDERQFGGFEVVPVQPDGQGGYLIDLGPTPSVDTLASFEFEDLLVTASARNQSRVELPSDGAWPARPPMRALAPSPGSLVVPVVRGDRGGDGFRLEVTSVLVGDGRAVVVLLAGDPIDGSLGSLPVSFNLLDGDRVVCSRASVLGSRGPQASPLLILDCPARPTAKLAIELAAGAEALRFAVKLPL